MFLGVPANWTGTAGVKELLVALTPFAGQTVLGKDPTLGVTTGIAKVEEMTSRALYFYVVNGRNLYSRVFTNEGQKGDTAVYCQHSQRDVFQV